VSLLDSRFIFIVAVSVMVGRSGGLLRRLSLLDQTQRLHAVFIALLLLLLWLKIVGGLKQTLNELGQLLRQH
jgi:hypothetical protein